MIKTCSIYAIESLNCWTFLFSILPHRIQDMVKGKSECELWFIQSTPLSLTLVSFLSPLIKLSYAPWTFKILDVKDDEGNFIRLKVLFDDSDEVHHYLLEESDFHQFLSKSQLPYDHVGDFLDKQIFSVNLFEEDAHWKKLLLIQTLNWDIVRRQLAPASIKVFLNTGILWSKALVTYAHRFNMQMVALHQYKFSLRNLIVRVLGEHNPIYMYHTYKHVGLGGVLRIIGAQLSGKKSSVVNQQQGSVSTLLVEYYGQMNIDKPYLYSDVFFWPYMNIPSRDMMLTFNVARDPLDQQKYDDLKKLGFRELVIHPEASTLKNANSFYFWPTGETLRNLRAKLPATTHRWITYQLDNYAQQFDYWKQLFAMHDVGIYVSWFKYGGRHCAIADALKMHGGIMVMYQRAMESQPSLGTRTCVDVFFGFSAHGAQLEKEQGSHIPYYVITGYNGDHRYELLRPHAKQLRTQLHQRGAKHIMAFFDENSHDDCWNTGHIFIQENYRFLLEKVLTEEWFGLILKPKVLYSLNHRLGKEAALLSKAVATGRCILLGEGKVGNSYPPAIAALASDIAVHGHLFAATAGLEAALTGVPTLLLDREGWRRSHLYQLGEGNVVFNDWPQLWQACTQSWEDPQEKRIGDWSTMIADFDPFRDGAAARRIGEYLTNLSQGLKAGKKRDQVLEEVAQAYMAKWGHDKIIRINPR